MLLSTHMCCLRIEHEWIEMCTSKPNWIRRGDQTSSLAAINRRVILSAIIHMIVVIVIVFVVIVFVVIVFVVVSATTA